MIISRIHSGMLLGANIDSRTSHRGRVIAVIVIAVKVIAIQRHRDAKSSPDNLIAHTF